MTDIDPTLLARGPDWSAYLKANSYTMRYFLSDLTTLPSPWNGDPMFDTAPLPDSDYPAQSNLIRYLLSETGTLAAEYRDSFPDVTPIHFDEDHSTTWNGTYGEVFIANIGLSNSSYKAVGIPPGNPGAGALFLDTNTSEHRDINQNQVAPGQEGFLVIMHELAHALGLHIHTIEIDQANHLVDSWTYTNSDGNLITVDSAHYPDGYRTQQYSIMAPAAVGSHGDTGAADLMHPDMVGVWPSGLQLFDIASLQSIYGRNYSTRGYGDPNHFTPDTTYAVTLGFGSTASTPFIYTIWDGGGIDIINAGNYTVPTQIDLRQGHFSSIGLDGNGAHVKFDNDGNDGIDHGNVAIAYHTVIENAITRDDAIGNDWSNVLAGMSAIDKIYADGFVFDDKQEGFVDIGGDPNDPYSVNDPNSYNPLNLFAITGDAADLPSDVLIGGGGSDTLFAGLGNDILHGGFNAAEITAIRSDWDSASQFTTRLQTLSHAGDGLGDGKDVADYSRLYLANTFGDTAAPDGYGIDVTFTGSGGVVHKGATTGTDVGNYGTDHLISIESVIGTDGNDVFVGTNGVMGDSSAIRDPNHSLAFQGGAGNDIYEFRIGTDYGSLRIDDSSGDSDTLHISNVTRFFLNSAFPGGDTLVQISLATGVLNQIAPEIYVNKTQIDLGHSLDFIEMNNKIFNAQKFVDAVTSFPQTWTPELMASAIGARIDGGDGADFQSGGNGPDYLNGGGGDDTQLAGGGDDILDGGSGVDSMYGGAGNDTYFVDNADDYLQEAPGEGASDTVISSVSFALPTDVENLTLTGTTSLVATGNSVANVLTSNGAGSTLIGGDGNDTYVVSNSTDVVSETGSDAADLVKSSVSFSLASISNVENLTLTGSASITATGDGGVNILIGNSGNNVLDGGANADTMIGGLGNDTYYVDNTLDVVSESGSAGTDTVISSVSYTLSLNAENLALTGSSNIDGTGNASDNILTSNTGVNTLTGGDGNDTYILNNVSDVVVESSGQGTLDTVQASFSLDLASYANVENLVLTGSSGLVGTGNSAANILTSNSGVDTLTGGLGDDTYVVNNASDVLTESTSAGTDLVQAGVNWTLGSNFENLTLTGTAVSGTGNGGANIITGNSGSNTLDGGTGADSMIGGGGTDVYTVDDTGDYVTGNGGGDLINSSISWDLSASHTTNVDKLTLTGSLDIDGTGNSHDNVLTGNDHVNILTGGAGNDTIDGGYGDDTMIGGTGNDVYYIQNFYDVVSESGSEGHDTVYFDGYGWDYTLASNVEDLIIVAALSASGNGLDNYIKAGTEVNTISGGAGNDVIDDAGLHTAQHLLGGTGNDTYIVSDFSSSTIVENSGEGHDTVIASVTWTLGSDVEDLILTGSSNLGGFGNSSNNAITGNSGNNYLDGGTGVDTLTGGAGNDTYLVNNSSDVVNENSGGGFDTVLAYADFTIADNVEILSRFGAGSATGNALANVITGDFYAQTLSGLGGDDTLQGNSGSAGSDDTLIGGTGNDLYIIDRPGDVIVENADEGTDSVETDASYTLPDYVENLTVTFTATTAVGNGLQNIIIANLADTLSGLGGDDTLSASTTSLQNTMIGGTGNDTYIVGAGSSSPVIVENSGEGTDTILSAKTIVMADYVEILTLTGSSNINSTGNDSANTMTGNSGNNTLFGGLGNDTLQGGGGTDTLEGQGGDDFYIVDSTNISITEASGGGIDTVQSSISWTLSSDVDNLILTGSSDLIGTGNGIANVLTSNSGVDTLTGGIGNDTYVINNAGDVIVENASEGTDVIQTGMDFSLASVSNVENLTLTGTGDYTATGDSGVNVLTGNSGNNILDGGAGADSMIGGAGDDTYFIDNVSDTVTEVSNQGNDTIVVSVAYTLPTNVENLVVASGSTNLAIVGNSAANIFTDNGDAITFSGSTGDDTYFVDDADDVVIENSSEGADTVVSEITWTLESNVEDLILTGSSNIDGIGNSLANVITSNSGVDTLTGAAGNDTYVVNNASDVIVENSSEGADLVQSSVSFALASNVENLSLTGFSDLDGTGNAAVNVITGNSGFNTLDGGSGADTMIGGMGNDVYVVDNSSDVVTENADEGIDTVLSTVTWTLGSDVENLTLTGSSSINGTGNSLDNILTSNSGVNTLTGGSGNDTYVISNASDVVVESSGTGSGTDIVQSSVSWTLGSNVEDLALTGSSNINGTGNSGDNVIISNSGVDTLTGGDGNDTYEVNNASDVVVENASEGTDLVESSVSFTLGLNVENLTLIGTSNVNATGNSGVNIIAGNDGDNSIDGGSGADTLAGGAGDDTYVVDNTSDLLTENEAEGVDLVQASVTFTLGDYIENLTLTGSSNINGTGNSLDNSIVSSSGVDTLTGGDGNDTYVVNNSSDVVAEGSGTDSGVDLVQSSVTFTLGSNVENLTLTGSSNVNGTGNSLDNILASNSGVDTLTGGAGDDTYQISNASDVVVENSGEGTDTVESSVTYTLGSNVEALTLMGSSNIDGTGNSDANVIAGNSGNNTLDGASGADTLMGGAGNDVYIVDNSGDVVVEETDEGTDLVQSSITWALDPNIENLTLTGSSNINGTGNFLDNVITSNTGINTLAGGLGNDTFVVNNASDVVQENASEGTDLVQSSVSFTLTSNIENLTLTGSSNLSGTGNGDVNVITGNSGSNVLDGGAGADTMIGGAGNDTYLVDNSSDVVTEGTSAGTDLVQASATFALGANVENLTLTGSSNINGTGNGLDNIITSNSGVDTLSGGAGNDTYFVSNTSDVVSENSGEGTDLVQSSVTFTLGNYVENLTLTGSSNINGTGNSIANILTSNSGVDTLTGGAGNDTYIVSNASDTVVENTGEGTDLVQSGVSFTLGNYVENLTLTGSSNINATGNSLDNVVTGNTGDNTLDGGSGNDTYVFSNGMGHDVVLDGGGTDTIQFDASVSVGTVIYSRDGNDLLIGYGTGSDTITVKNYFAGSSNQIEEILFSGGTTHDVTYVTNHANVFTGTSGDDAFGGTSSADTMSGLGGNDTLNAFAGNDTLDGGSGNDTLNGGTGSDTMTGGTGDDTFVVDDAGDVVSENSGEGTDTVQSSIGYTLGNYVENLTLTGSSNINGTGNSLDNILTSNTGVDTLTGGSGNDTYVVSNSSDVIVENSGEGTDLVQSSVNFTLAANVENPTLTGSSSINGTGNGGANILTGNSGDNSLDGGLGADSMIGGTGNDTYVVDNASDIISENSGEGTDLVQAGISYTLGSYVENLTLTGSASLNGTGNGLDNIITSNTGVDTLTGAAGNDTYVVNNASDVVVENAAEGTDLVQSSVSFSLNLMSNVENLTLTGSSNINGTGNSAVNIITGNTGNNSLDGGTGADTMVGGAGDDTYAIDNSSDVITENTGEGTDLAISSVSYTLSNYVDNLTLTGSSSLSGTGNGQDNLITSNSGVDTLTGGDGNDTYIVNNTSDVIVEGSLTGSGTDTIQVSASWDMGSGGHNNANVENLTLTGSGNYSGTGNSLVNIITGNTGDNVLDGGSGADTLIGGTGNDTYVVDNTSDVVTENTGEGTDLVQSSVSFTLSNYIENLTLTGSSTITGTGNGQDNIISSNSGVNSLVGGAGNDTYIVSNSSDVIVENSGEGTDLAQSSVSFTLGNYVDNLTLTGSSNLDGTGSAQDNTITGNSGVNTLSGGDGNDLVSGMDGNDSLAGGNGADTLDGGNGNDTMAGGAGDDVYTVDSTSDVVNDNSGEGTDFVQSSVTWTLGSNTENLTLTGSSTLNGTGNSDANIITGNSGVNILTGNDGNDYLVGGSSNDSLVGGNGNDTLDGGTGNDTMTGGAGDDTYIVDSTSDVLTESASSGADIVQSSVDWTLGTNFENLTLTGSSNINGTGNTAVNIITGNSGNNSLDGGSGADTMTGGLGDDTYAVDNASDVVLENANEGIDLVMSSVDYTLGSTLENLTLTGGGTASGTGNNLDNYIIAASHTSTLDGGAGNDTLDDGGGGSSSTLIGGLGDDSFILHTPAHDVLVESSGGGTDTVTAEGTYTLDTDVENLILGGTSSYNGTGNGSDNAITGNSAINNLSGAAGNDTIYGMGGNDSLDGSTGNDTLDGGSGNDHMTGGAGDDTYVVDSTSDAVTEAGSSGTDTVLSSVTWTLGSNFENLTLTGSSNINGIGNTLVNILTGNSGNNSLDGGTAADTMIGGTGDDTYAIDNASDVVTENSGEGTDTVVTSLSSYTLASNVENLTMTNAGSTGIGNALNNIITGPGGAGTGTLSGGDGNDTLDYNGGLGSHSLIGGLGDDTFYVRSTGVNGDHVIENSNEGTDTVLSTVNYTLDSNVENLSLLGSTGIDGVGNTLNNAILGNTGANSLSGSSGNDTLDGGDGLDHLIGGTGADTFVFHLGTAFNNVDVVTDFNKVTDNDKLDVHDILSGYDPAHDVITNWVRITDSGSNSVVEIDRDGTGGTYGWTQIATLNGITGLTDEAALVSSGNLIVT